MNVGTNTLFLMMVSHVLTVHQLMDVLIVKAHQTKLSVFNVCSH